MNRLSFRSAYLLGFLVCAALIGFALYSQFQWGLQPCPLCIFQRIAFAVLGLMFLIGALHALKGAGGRRVYGVLAFIAAAVGIGIAGRHVWLTHLPPDQVPHCGPPLEFMMETNALTDVIRKVLTGSGECAKVDWTFLGLSMPAWSLTWFVLLAVWALWMAFRRR
ncbi:disulfide bond formation protein B [Luteimonas gilva]|uniref:Disulfide bond formation protein B n=1 Tax=Luteimonas gilva TaxID=2572684 RepID=A0A4U5JWE1_9GAMM|nr:disulfide bond formation protein B [Luteimonas gilva]TKR33965.1 disulfide bond formation protein B [Luteimonas gilva]